jgi:hypothetical protein
LGRGFRDLQTTSDVVTGPLPSTLHSTSNSHTKRRQKDIGVQPELPNRDQGQHDLELRGRSRARSRRVGAEEKLVIIGGEDRVPSLVAWWGGRGTPQRSCGSCVAPLQRRKEGRSGRAVAPRRSRRRTAGAEHDDLRATAEDGQRRRGRPSY